MAAKLIFLLLMFFMANLGWVSDKWLGMVGTIRQLWQRFAVLVPSYLITLAIASLVERLVMGQVWPQGWEFYSINLCVFLVLSFPGFIYRVLWK
ncbi:DUF2818 family protein [Methylophilus medardicus]|uniref:DUF2818 family protein n=1 Tax=Methylophilus medardicus TaxID=2588534 RepID=A0A5B8CRM6_9PROT|nr:DUF2818 family protein [Methylophilus medardicus]QDC43819.1 DUF2818 family protein [Methylophilus medardicus]QDC48826.1 DUF2818 family protein [Methylophilus medardicus]QDC52531.1 DUF2818 family protein [Methylophilus medardicus]